MLSPLAFLGLEASRGTKASGAAALVDGDSGQFPKSPLVIVNGRKPGPKVWLLAGIHGDEIEPMVTLQRVFQDVDPEELAGAIVGILITNPAAFWAWERESPLDGKDLDNVFPGNRQGTFSDRLARKLFDAMVGLVSEEDCLVTLEGGGRDVLSARLIEVRGSGDAHEERAMTLAHTLCNPNLRIIVRIEERAGAWATIYGSTITREIARVVPAARLTVEAGGMGLMIEHDIQAHYDAVFNLLKAMGMYPGSPKVPAEEIIEIEENARVSPRRSGFWKRWVDVGAWVKAGDRLAAVLDELGTEIETLVAPFHGIVLYIRGFGLVNPLASRQNPRYGVNVGRYAKPS